MNSPKKRAFVIMPIKAPGTKEHEHFRALFDGIIAPAIAEFGFEVKRADDFQSSGAITKDIILPLATADLVVADLTALNPNVFYELGVRHTLVRRGTIMIMEESQTDIPFDIQAYRVIKFRGDISGINALRKELSGYVQQLERDEYSGRDNLVHDWLPTLPGNVYASSTDGIDRSQGRLIASLERQVTEYRERYGVLSEQQGRPNPRARIRAALEEAKAGNLPEEIVARAEAYAAKQDVRGYLEQVDKALGLSSMLPTKAHYIRLRTAAESLEIDSLEVAIADQATLQFPDDEDLARRRLATYAHSDQTDLLNEAIAGFQKYLGLMSDDPVDFSQPLKESDLTDLSIMLDAYHRLRLHEKALNIIRRANEILPNRALILRNLGRALERVGSFDEALEQYRLAASASDSDDQAPAWLATQLYNRDRLVDACEAYALAAVRDPDDGSYFARFARTVAAAMRNTGTPDTVGKRMLPPSIARTQSVTQAISAALACRVTQSISKVLSNAAKYAEISMEDILQEEKNPSRAQLLSARARLDLAREFYAALASPLTSQLMHSDRSPG